MKSRFSLEDLGLPPGVSYNEFFDKEMLSELQGRKFINIQSEQWLELFKTYSNNQEYMNILLSLLCEKGGAILSEEFDKIMNNEELVACFMKAFFEYLKTNKVVKQTVMILIVNNDKLLNVLLNDKTIDISNLKEILKNSRIRKEVFLKLLSDQRFLNIFFKYDASSFFSTIKSKNVEIELYDLIQMKIKTLSYEEKISLVTNRNLYNPETGTPEYLKELYITYEDRIELNNIRKKILEIKENSSEEEKKQIKEYLNTSEGQALFLKEILEPKFSTIIKVLDLDSSLYQLRKEMLFEELNNYEKYDIKTVKELLCIYCFEDNCNNVMLKLKTLIEYANDNTNVLMILKDDIHNIIRLHSYLVQANPKNSPLDLISRIDINGLISKVHSLFSDEVNRKTDISDILNSEYYVEKNGVKVFNTELPIDKSYFLVHSISTQNLNDNVLDSYINNAAKHNRICTSILDNNHTKTFLEGIVFGYCNIGAPMYSAVPFDGQTNQRVYGDNEKGKPQYRSILTGVDKFMKRTTSKYNELTYMTDNKVIMPSYIFVANREPNELEYKVAKEFNIPIFIYHTKDIEYEYIYSNDRSEPFDYESHTLDYIPNDIYYETKQK